MVTIENYVFTEPKAGAAAGHHAGADNVQIIEDMRRRAILYYVRLEKERQDELFKDYQESLKLAEEKKADISKAEKNLKQEKKRSWFLTVPLLPIAAVGATVGALKAVKETVLDIGMDLMDPKRIGLLAAAAGIAVLLGGPAMVIPALKVGVGLIAAHRGVKNSKYIANGVKSALNGGSKVISKFLPRSLKARGLFTVASDQNKMNERLKIATNEYIQLIKNDPTEQYTQRMETLDTLIERLENGAKPEVALKDLDELPENDKKVFLRRAEEAILNIHHPATQPQQSAQTAPQQQQGIVIDQETEVKQKPGFGSSFLRPKQKDPNELLDQGKIVGVTAAKPSESKPGTTAKARAPGMGL